MDKKLASDTFVSFDPSKIEQKLSSASSTSSMSTLAPLPSQIQTIEANLTKTISDFKKAVIVSVTLIAWTNIMLLWAMQVSSSHDSLYVPLSFNLLVTGSMITAVCLRREILHIQHHHQLASIHKNRDIERDYRNFTFICFATFPLLAIIAAVTFFHITMYLKDGDGACPTTYFGTLQNLNPNGKAITVLYFFSYIGIYLSAIYANFLAPKICRLYDERLPILG